MNVLIPLNYTLKMVKNMNVSFMCILPLKKTEEKGTKRNVLGKWNIKKIQVHVP